MDERLLHSVGDLIDFLEDTTAPVDGAVRVDLLVVLKHLEKALRR